MIHRLSALHVTEKLRESMQDSGDDFRFAAIESNLAEYADKCSSWHWHEFVEFALVAEGALECCTPTEELRLGPGDGYFINANVLHLTRMAPDCAAARLLVFQFETSLLTSAGGLSRRYVTPVERCAALGVEVVARPVSTVENGYVRHHPGHLARELILLHADRSVRIAGDSFGFHDDTYRVE